jgi:hypothetical protein
MIYGDFISTDCAPTFYYSLQALEQHREAFMRGRKVKGPPEIILRRAWFYTHDCSDCTHRKRYLQIGWKQEAK